METFSDCFENAKVPWAHGLRVCLGICLQGFLGRLVIIMENQMETTIMENQMEKKMENEMEAGNI